MKLRPRVASLAVIGAVAIVSACELFASTPSGEPGGTSAQPDPTELATPSPSPTATPIPDVEVPLAVVTGFTNLKSEITGAEVDAALAADTLIQPCEILGPGVAGCTAAEAIPALIHANPESLAFLPWQLVSADIKALPIDGADLFGSEAARTRPYPYTATVSPELGWEPYDVSRIRTMISPGNTCHDRGPAHAALTLGRGWDWVFGGGTAVYGGFNAEGGTNTVVVIPTGNEGAMAELMRSGDVTYNDIECPFVNDFRVNTGTVFSLDPSTIPLLRDTYGIDVVIFAANHPFDQGTDGFLESLEHFKANGLPYTGAGINLDEALTPATFEVDGLTFGFVGHNEIPGPIAAGPDQPGVAWLQDDHVIESVRRAREVADVVICVPQWWGSTNNTTTYGAEYSYEWRGDMRRQQQVYYDAGCDHVLGQGTHYSGPIDLDVDEQGKARLTVVSSGNFLFGQGWSQDTQEGVVFELTFRDADLVQIRIHPYVMLDQAQTNLTDPEGDGHYVLERIFEHSAPDLP